MEKLTPPPEPAMQFPAPTKDQDPKEKLETLRRMLSLYISSVIDYISRLDLEVNKSSSIPTQSSHAQKIESIARKIVNSSALYPKGSSAPNSPAKKMI